MLVHSVYFWLKVDCTQEQTASFHAGLESLRDIPSVEALHLGTIAETKDRPVIDRTYTFSLTVILKDVAAHDVYQADPIHQEFLKMMPLVDHVTIYDAD